MSLFSIFGTVFLEESEKDVGLVFVKASLELSDDWRNFNSGEKDSFLSLEGNVLGPSDESGKIPLGLDTIANTEVSRF